MIERINDNELQTAGYSLEILDIDSDSYVFTIVPVGRQTAVAAMFTRLKINNDMHIISLRTNPEYEEQAIQYLQNSWPEVDPIIYEDCLHHSIGAEQALPQWYLLETNNKIIGCAGLITNDFISRMDLYPWLCALFIDEAHRGNNYAALLIEQAKKDTKTLGFKYLNLCTDHTGYYEKYGFNYIGQGYHPWESSSRIYQIEV